MIRFSIETLLSQALIDLEVSHEERDKYEKIKENLKNVSKNMSLNNVNSKNVTSL